MKKQPAARRPELVLVLSDLHVGSTVGLLPPQYRTIEGNAIELNAVQAFLWDAWRDMLRWVEDTTAGANYAVVINGDLIEGDHHGTKQIWSKDTSDHVAAAAEVLQPVLSRASHFFIVQGTESHTNNHEISLGKILRAQNNPDTGLPAFTRLHLTVHGCRCAFSHHIGTATRSWTKATALAAALAEERTQAIKNGEQVPQVVVRSHRHTFDSYTDGRGSVVVTPPWQMLTRFGHKVVPDARCQPGAVLLDWRGVREGGLPKVNAKTYDAPPQTAVEI